MGMTKDANLTEKRTRKPGHVCDENCTKRFGFCIQARNEERWNDYLNNPFPVFGKSGKYTPQRASVPGRS